MKTILPVFISSIFLYGCVSHAAIKTNNCKGNTNPPVGFSNNLEPVNDPKLLAQALGKPLEGGLCQGQVYQVKDEFIIHRAWNSTNQGSQMGNWWTFSKPEGSVSQYREKEAVCYQWTPLDMLTSCTLTAGARIVVGTGQSAKCSDYLTYPVSSAKQIYIDKDSVTAYTRNCTTETGQFKWSGAK